MFLLQDEKIEPIRQPRAAEPLFAEDLEPSSATW